MCKVLKKLFIIPILMITACTTVNVDHIKLEENLALESGDAIVILGRHHSAEFETESTLISCIGNKIRNSTNQVQVIPEQQFVNDFYPWFEARTAPLHPKKLKIIFDQPQVTQKMQQLNIRYFVWIEGSTEKTNSAGSMGCAVGPGGAGCFGFGTWEDTSDYETSIWDFGDFREVGRISTDAVGTSYLPSFVIPIPLLARVEGDACEGMGKQLVDFFASNKQKTGK